MSPVCILTKPPSPFQGKFRVASNFFTFWMLGVAAWPPFPPPEYRPGFCVCRIPGNVFRLQSSSPPWPFLRYLLPFYIRSSDRGFPIRPLLNICVLLLRGRLCPPTSFSVQSRCKDLVLTSSSWRGTTTHPLLASTHVLNRR